MVTVEVRNNVRILRQTLSMSQRQLSKETGIKRYRISLAESGRYVFDESELLKLSEILKVPAEAIYPQIQK